jgi:hypothetical protein
VRCKPGQSGTSGVLAEIGAGRAVKKRVCLRSRGTPDWGAQHWQNAGPIDSRQRQKTRHYLMASAAGWQWGTGYLNELPTLRLDRHFDTTVARSI